jgi:hypothetical protein
MALGLHAGTITGGSPPPRCTTSSPRSKGVEPTRLGTILILLTRLQGQTKSAIQASTTPPAAHRSPRCRQSLPDAFSGFPKATAKIMDELDTSTRCAPAAYVAPAGRLFSASVVQIVPTSAQFGQRHRAGPTSRRPAPDHRAASYSRARRLSSLAPGLPNGLGPHCPEAHGGPSQRRQRSMVRHVNWWEARKPVPVNDTEGL